MATQKRDPLLPDEAKRTNLCANAVLNTPQPAGLLGQVGAAVRAETLLGEHSHSLCDRGMNFASTPDSMDGNTLQQIRNALLSRREQLDGGDREREILGMEELPTNQAEVVDIAQAIEQLDRDQSLAVQERRELVAIERALAKMSSGAFGVCEDCDEEILPKRLIVLPEARLCAKCQEFDEKLQGRTARSIQSAIAR